MEDLYAFVDQFFTPTAQDDHLEYLHNASKPFWNDYISVLRVVSHLGLLLPGSYNTNNQVYLPLYCLETEYKQAPFRLMPMAWRIKFAESAYELDNNKYSYSQLTSYLSLQEAIKK